MKKFTGLVYRYPKILFWIVSYVALYAMYPIYWLYALRVWYIGSIAIGAVVTLTYYVAESFIKTRYAIGALLSTLLLGINVLAAISFVLSYVFSYPDDEPTDAYVIKLLTGFMFLNFMFAFTFYFRKILSQRRLQQQEKVFQSFQY